DAHLWAEKYNGTLDDVFDIQEKVSRSIVDALKVKLSPEENVQIAEHSIYNIQAYECYLKARQEIWRFTEGGLERALQLLRNGLEIVGNNELLFSTMGIIYWQYINAGIKPDIKYLAEIENYSKNVYDMNPDFPGGHFLKGVIHHLRGDLNKAVKEYKKSLENDPNNPDTLLEIIRIYSSAGKTSVAKPLVKRLLDIDPLTPINHCMPGFISYSEGSFKNAIIEPHYMMYKMDPQNPLGRWFYAWALTWNQRLEEAYKIIDILVKDTPHLIFAQLGLFWKHTFQGRKQDALNVVKPELLKAAEYSDFLSRDIAHCYAILDEKVEALYWLENAVDRGWINYPLINEYDPFFENIRGEPRFKKLMKRVKHEWEQFDSDDPQPYIEEEETELPESQEKSIAVLPFANMSADPDQEYFCDGMAEEIINALTHIEQLKVIARTSAFMFKGKNEDMREIGKKLDVGHLLEGSVRKSGNRLRITAQLIKVSDGSHLWSEKYDRELEDVFEIQDEISLAIVDNLKVKLLGADKDVLVKHYTENMEAYDLYLKGKYTLNISTEKSMSQGIECFRKAIEIDPDFTLAYTGLSYHYYWSAMLGFISPDDAYKQSKDVGYKALQLDRDLDEAHISMANIHLFYEWDWKNAEKEYRIALEINPRNPNAHTNLSPLLTAVGREEEAIFHCRKAVELDPLSPMTNIYYGCMLCLLGNFDDSIIQLEKLLQLLPNFVFAHAELAWNYAFLGQYEEALSECEKVNELGLESFWMRSTIANVYAISGRKDKAVETIEDLQKVSKSHYMDSFNYAVIYAGLGEKDLSFENLKKAYQERSMQIYSLHIFKRTWFKSIADDPRYKELLIKMDLDL
ncbi:MAG: hypothetical protein GY863_01545, partial [bacterium]|nr:hypothetical protein [bacterium]